VEIKDLNKQQLILLAVLLSFVTSIATGITTVTLMQQAPESVTVPITQVVRETVEKVVPAATPSPALSPEQKKLLEDLKAIKPLTVTLVLRKEGAQDKVLGTGLFLGNNRVVIASSIKEASQDEAYVVKSVLGEQKVSKVTPEKDFTVIELVDNTPPGAGEGEVEGATTPEIKSDKPISQ